MKGLRSDAFFFTKIVLVPIATTLATNYVDYVCESFMGLVDQKS